MWIQVNKETKIIVGVIEMCKGTPIPEDGCELVEVTELPDEWYYSKWEEGNIKLDDNFKQTKIKEDELNDIRAQRELECFPIINRGTLWYSKLTTAQTEELDSWYQQWLDAPDTKVIPTKPEWLI